MRKALWLCVGVALFGLSSTAEASTFRFDTDPFAGTTALQTPGRQVIGNELFINIFDIATDVFSLDPAVFGTGDVVDFVNTTAADIPATGVNVVVLQTFDDDNNAGTPFGAGQAANLIASQITTPGPGFFVYFNQGLDLPRLVFSTDLSSNTADLKVLARLLNLNGAIGRNAIPTFTAANFDFAETPAVPEPATLTLFAAAGVTGVCQRLLRRSA